VDGNFLATQYSRAHKWHFDGGAVVAASASPHIVPPPWSSPENVDPAEAFVAPLASCHMLFFLSIAASKNLVVQSYSDSACGRMEENPQGKLAIIKVFLRPAVEFARGAITSEAAVMKTHHLAHEKSFLASSVKTKILIEPVI
jgi:organic hydroperoxide reductase OsmC/OhrA